MSAAGSVGVDCGKGGFVMERASWAAAVLRAAVRSGERRSVMAMGKWYRGGIREGRALSSSVRGGRVY